MSQRFGEYDAGLQMFKQPPAELDFTRLGWLRWMVEQGHIESSLVRDAETGPTMYDVLIDHCLSADSGEMVDTTFIRAALYRQFDARHIAQLVRDLDTRGVFVYQENSPLTVNVHDLCVALRQLRDEQETSNV